MLIYETSRVVPQCSGEQLCLLKINILSMVETNKAAYGLHDHGDIQDGVCLTCVDDSLRNIDMQA